MRAYYQNPLYPRWASPDAEADIYNSDTSLDFLYARSAYDEGFYDGSLYARDASPSPEPEPEPEVDESLLWNILAARAAYADPDISYDDVFDLFIRSENPQPPLNPGSNKPLPPPPSSDKPLPLNPGEANTLGAAAASSQRKRPAGVPEAGIAGGQTTFPQQQQPGPSNPPPGLPASTAQDRYNEQKANPGTQRWKKVANALQAMGKKDPKKGKR